MGMARPCCRLARCWSRDCKATGTADIVNKTIRYTSNATDPSVVTVQYTIEDEHGPNPEIDLEQGEMKEALGEAIARLPEREKLVITLYYYEELTLREIGEVLGVTESRVSQLHTKAVLRLKARLSGGQVREPVEKA